MSGKKISAKIKAPGCDEYRAYFQESDDMVLAWRAGEPWSGYKTERYNGGVFSRDWVRAALRNDVEVTF